MPLDRDGLPLPRTLAPFPTAFKQGSTRWKHFLQEGVWLSPRAGRGYGKVSSLLWRGTLHGGLRGACQLSSSFLWCHEHPENKQSLWIPVSPAAKLCPAPPSARLQLVNGLRGMWDPEHVWQWQEMPGNRPRSVFIGSIWQLQPCTLVSISDGARRAARARGDQQRGQEQSRQRWLARDPLRRASLLHQPCTSRSSKHLVTLEDAIWNTVTCQRPPARAKDAVVPDHHEAAQTHNTHGGGV